MKYCKKTKSRVRDFILLLINFQILLSCGKPNSYICFEDIREDLIKNGEIYEIKDYSDCDGPVLLLSPISTHETNLLSKLNGGIFLTKAEFKLFNNKSKSGFFIFSGNRLEIDMYQPYIFSSEGGHIPFYTGITDPNLSREKLIKNFGNTKNIFPIEARTHLFEFKIPGIFYLADKKLMILKEIQPNIEEKFNKR